MKVSFVGAGPGDPGLITLTGRARIEEADLVIYAGSLVNPALLEWARPGIPIHDSSSMNFDEVTGLYQSFKDQPGLIVRLHTGDPSLYGAIQEQIDFCHEAGIEIEVVPGVSSVFAAAAALQRELTLPGISQTLILTRTPGRTPVPAGQEPGALAVHGATMALFLSAPQLAALVQELLPHYGPDCPIRLVHRASWPDEQLFSGTLATICTVLPDDSPCRSGQLMILVGPALDPSGYERSKLYDPGFTHGCRQARPV